MTRPAIALSPGDVAAIEASAWAASDAVAHLHVTPEQRTRRCGHRVTSSCTDLRCTAVRPWFASV